MSHAIEIDCQIWRNRSPMNCSLLKSHFACVYSYYFCNYLLSSREWNGCVSSSINMPFFPFHIPLPLFLQVMLSKVIPAMHVSVPLVVLALLHRFMILSAIDYFCMSIGIAFLRQRRCVKRKKLVIASIKMLCLIASKASISGWFYCN